jgi:hypothetical protein
MVCDFECQRPRYSRQSGREEGACAQGLLYIRLSRFLEQDPEKSVRRFSKEITSIRDPMRDYHPWESAESKGLWVKH